MFKNLFVVLFMLTFYMGFSQQSLVKVIEEISNSYDVEFAYPSELLDKISIATVTEQDNLEEQLEVLFQDLPIEYKIFDGNKILLRKKTIIEHKTYEVISIKGLVLDNENKDGLISATVYLDDYLAGCYTNDKGKYHLKINQNDLNKSVIISYLGYEEIKISIKELIAKPRVYLKLSELSFETVVISHITPSVQNNLDGSYKLKKESLSNNAGFSSHDLFRSIQMVSGITATDDDESGIKIRSSNANQTLIILDEMPIYNSSHYYGIFSNINKNYVDEINLYKNILPIEYVGFAAGMLEMKSNEMASKFEGQIDLNLIAPSINLKIPIDSSFQLKLAGRISVLDISSILSDSNPDQVFNFLSDNLQRRAIDKVRPELHFYDLNGQARYSFSNNTSIEYNFFKSSDVFLLNYENEFKAKKNGNENSLKERYTENRNWSNQTNSIVLKTSLLKTLDAKLIAYTSSYNHSNDILSFFKNNNNNNEIERNASLSNVIDEKAIKGIIKKTINRSYLQVGIDYNRFQVSQFIEQNDNEIINIDNKAQRISLSSSYTIDKDIWYLDFGTRINNYTYKNVNNYSLSPQAYFKFRPTNDLFLKASIGRNVQYLRLINFQRNDGNSVELYRLANNSGIPPIYSNNYMIGFNKTFSKWNIDIEFYKKDIEGSIEFASRIFGFEGNTNSAPALDEFKLYRGATKIHGMDLGLNYSSRFYNGLLSYTLSKADNYFSSIFEGSAFPNENDRRHELNWTNNFTWNKFNFSANYIYGSGKPYLDLEGLESFLDRESANIDNLYQQLDYYARVDLGLSYQLPIKKNNATIGVSVLNVLDRDNVKYRQQTFSIAFDGNDANDNMNAVIGSESSLLERTLNVSFGYAW